MERHLPFTKCLLLLTLMLWAFESLAQVRELWAKRYDGSGNHEDAPVALAVDAAGNVYVTGESYGVEGNADFTTIKYNAAGNALWVKRYNGAANHIDAATDLALDAQGHVYVTGYSYNAEGNSDYLTIKYDGNGNEQWVRRYDGPGDFQEQDRAWGLVVDALGHVYVTGSSTGDNTGDYTTIKYDAAGNELWVRRYDGPVGSTDVAEDIALDGQGHVYVTGWSFGDAFRPDYATVKYNAQGDQLWVKRYGDEGEEIETARKIVVDAAGNVYVTGSDQGFNTNDDITTIKYNAAGDEVWKRTYSGPGNFNDSPFDLAIDALGNVYITGLGFSSASFEDYVTIKYDAAGNEVWVRTYNGPANGNDGARSLAVDAAGSVYVTGASIGHGSSQDFTTLKYNAAGNEVWAIRYNGPANGVDRAAALAVDALGHVYVTGSSESDYATIRYVQEEAPVVLSFTLIDAVRNQDIRELKNGDVVNPSNLPARLTVRANTSPATVGSVVFNLGGQQTYTHIENRAPYTLLGNSGSNYFGLAPQAGNYTLEAIPYAGKNGQGQKGVSYTISFSVAEGFITNHTGAASNKHAALVAELDKEGVRLSATPNPFAAKTTLYFSVPQTGYAALDIYDMKGVLVQRLLGAQAEKGILYSVDFQSKHLPTGVYAAWLTAGGKAAAYQLMLVR